MNGGSGSGGGIHRICDDLTAFVDQELDDSMAQVFRDHLSTCEACRRALPEEAALTARFSTLGADEEPPTSRIKAALQRLGADEEPPPGWEARIFAQITAGSRLETTTRSMYRMIPGEFVGPGQGVGDTPTRFASAVLPRLASDPANDHEFVGLDLVQVSLADNPHDWTWAALSEAGVYTMGHTIGLNLGEPWRFVTWAFGAPRVYTVAYAELLAPEDIGALYGPDAAGSARRDYKAVQLTLVDQKVALQRRASSTKARVFAQIAKLKAKNRSMLISVLVVILGAILCALIGVAVLGGVR